MLDLNNDRLVLRSDVENVLTRVDLRTDDTRLAQSMSALDVYHKAIEA